AVNHRAFGGHFTPGAQPPPWLALQQDLDSQGITVDPVAVVDDAGEPLPATREVLGLAARHQLVVATGHLSAFEARAIADAARAAGLRQAIAPPPDSPQQDMSLDDQLALARQGSSWNAVSARRTRACATGPAWSPISGPPGPRRRS